MAAILDSADTEHSYYQRKFYWVLFIDSILQNENVTIQKKAYCVENTMTFCQMWL